VREPFKAPVVAVRIEALPVEATPLQHAEVLAALSRETEIIRLRAVA
jgi:hypothetical protein